MSRPAWLADPIASLIAPFDAETFFREYHEHKALIVHRDDPARYEGLLSIDRIDAIQAKVIEGKALDWEEEEFLSDCRIKAWNPALRQHTGAIPCYCGFISEAKTNCGDHCAVVAAIFFRLKSYFLQMVLINRVNLLLVETCPHIHRGRGSSTTLPT